MVIGFDFDKVFINYPPLFPSYIFDKFYKKPTRGELIYRIPNRPEQWLRLALHYPLLRPLIKQNLAILKEHAADSKNTYYLISSRFKFLKQRTDQLILKHEFDKLFTDIYFNYENKQPHLFKNEIIKKLKVERFVDDDLELIQFLSSQNPKTYFYWLNPTLERKMRKNLMAITSLSSLFK